ncbi:UNVERIFIED_ORG: hypothetical protein [Escherichia phage CMSTMSU]
MASEFNSNPMNAQEPSDEPITGEDVDLDVEVSDDVQQGGMQ